MDDIIDPVAKQRMRAENAEKVYFQNYNQKLQLKNY